MKTATQRAGPWLVTIVLVALIIRWIPIAFVYTDRLVPKRDSWAFGYEMGRIGRSLASGHGFSSPFIVPTGPSAFQAPIYPLLLAGVFKLSAYLRQPLPSSRSCSTASFLPSTACRFS